MSWMTRLKNALNSHRLEEDISAEIQDHMDRRIAALEREGLNPEDARRRAALAFGNAAAFREQSRELRLWGTLEGTLKDTRYALRGLLRKPVFAFTAIASLSLAIGANTAVYSILDAVLLRPLPVPDPSRLVALSTNAGLTPGDDRAFSYPMYEQLLGAAGSSARLALFGSPNRVEAQGASGASPYEEVVEQVVSPNAFDVLEVHPALGALFSPAEDRLPSPRQVVVLSYDYWVRRFGGDLSVVGRRLIVSGSTYSILGVARRGFSGDEPGRPVDVWLPVTDGDPGIFTNPEFRPFHLLGRLAPGAAAPELALRLGPAFHNHQAARIEAANNMPPALQKQLGEMKLNVSSGATGNSRFAQLFGRSLWVLAGIAACILLIACANLASLLLARAAARSPEMALRISLGAGRGRLLRQLLAESLTISTLAGLGGWLLARIAAPALVALVSIPGEPVRLHLATNTRTLLFSLAICTLSAIFFGALPAWQASSPRPMQALRHLSGRAGSLRTGRFFVGIQVAFAFCLVAGGAGFLFSLRNLDLTNTGFVARGVTVLTMTNDATSHDRQFALMRQLQLRIARMPNVQGAAVAWLPIFSGSRRAQRVLVAGVRPAEREETFYRVGPGYFATLRTPLLSGRDLTYLDNDNEPVPSVVNLAFARRYFGTEAALGRQFQRDDGVRHQVVGIAADSHYGDLRGGPEPIAYMPMKPPRAFTLYIRSTLDAPTLSKMVAREAAQLGSAMRIRDTVTLDGLVGSTILRERLLAAVSGVFALLGLILTAVGLFGLLNYTVERRTKEIGIRTALGARRLPIYGLVLRDLARVLGVGMLIGSFGAVALMRGAKSLLFGVQPADPIVIGTAVAVFVVVASIAGGLPAGRAAAMDPIAALRQE